jgi:hypothetical protein
MDTVAANAIAEELQEAKMARFASKDIFRASGLSSLGVSDSHVEKDVARIMTGERLSPLLLYRDKTRGRLIIADGYHRLCAVYKLDQDALIPCKIC